MVENLSPVWGSTEKWEVAQEPSLEIGAAAGDSMTLFSEVVGARLLSDGRLVVVDGSTQTIRYFDADGVFLTRSGGVGDGPGEFRRIAHFKVVDGDSIVAVDWDLQRVSWFAPDGSFARSGLLPVSQLEGFIVPIGRVKANRLLVSALGWPIGLDPGLQRRDLRLWSIDLSGDGHRMLGTFRGPQEVLRGSTSIGYEFGARTELTANDSVVYVVSTERSVVEGLDAETGDLQLRFSWPWEATAVTQDLLSTAMEERISRMPAGVPEVAIEGFRARRLDETVAPVLPMVRSVVVDRGGHLWVEPYPVPGEHWVRFQVFRPDGVWLGEVTMPEGMKRGTSTQFDPILDIGHDFVISVWVDPLGVESVRRYELERT